MALTDNIVAYWKLDESSGDATDATGNGNTGTNNGVDFATGKINNGGSFANDGDDFDMGTTSNLAMGTGNCSFSAWVKVTTIRESIILTRDNVSGSTRRMYQLGITSAGKLLLQFYAADGGNNNIQGNTTLSLNTWYHVVGVRDSSNIRIYLNGSEDQTAVASTNNNVDGTNSPRFLIGETYNQATQYSWRGMIDEVGVWSRALTGTEITELYNSGAGLQYPFGSATIIPSPNLLTLGVG